MRKFLAIIICKLTKKICKYFGRGSSFPGQLALKICPDILSRIDLPENIIAVTGSNGKTSTVEMIHGIIENAGMTRTEAVCGSLLASFSVMLPSFILMLLISAFFMHYKDHKSVQTVLKWLRPVVVGMLAAAVLLLLNEENLGTFSAANLQLYVSIGLFILAFVATYFWKIGPIKVILMAGLFGGLFYSLI